MTASKKLIQAAAGVGGGEFYPYTVDYSARFEDGGDAKAYRTHSTPTSDQRFTYSTWFKHANVTTNSGILFYVRNSAWNRYFAIFAYPPSGTYAGKIYVSCNPNGTIQDVAPSALFRDFSAWYHLVLAVDSTEVTSTDRVKLYINGERVTDWVSGTAPNNVTLNQSIASLQSGGITAIGGRDDVSNVQMYDGYLSQTAFIDGTAYASTDFGESKNGVWIPKDISGLSFGNNGYYLDYADSSAFGNDVSGNNNDLTTNGLTSADQMIDTPTNNYCTLNSVFADYYRVYRMNRADGNLYVAGNNSAPAGYITDWSTFAFDPEDDTGYYWEVYIRSRSFYASANNTWGMEPLVGSTFTGGIGTGGTGVGLLDVDASSAQIREDGTTTYSGLTSVATGGCVLMFAYKAGKFWIGRAGTWYNSGAPASDAGNIATLAYISRFGIAGYGGASSTSYTSQSDLNFGQNGTFNGQLTAGGNADANGNGDFYYSVPSGFLALCTANLPEPTLGPNSAENVTDYFAPILYTGNGTAIGSGGKAVTGVGFQPDKVGIKNRDAADSWMIFDDVRGATKYIEYDSPDDEATDTESLSTFDTDGFTLGNNVAVNTNTEDYVGYCWRENTGFFDIVEYAGTGAAHTVAHNLDVAPNFIAVKALDDGGLVNWMVYVDGGQVTDPETDVLILSTNNAVQDILEMWNDTAPTSSNFTVGTHANVNKSGNNHVAYLFANMDGMCKVGSYTGNGSADGPFIYCGFAPAFILVKETGNVNNWLIFDVARTPTNASTNYMLVETAAAEGITANTFFDILSNGFKARANQTSTNRSSGNFIFIAFAEMPFKYSNAR